MSTTSQLVPDVPTAAGGFLLPESVLHWPLFGLLAAFVAINTVVYVALAVVKMLPTIPVGSLLNRRDRRSEDRSIYPEDPTRTAAKRGSEWVAPPPRPDQNPAS